jgi:hypothetical protein
MQKSPKSTKLPGLGAPGSDRHVVVAGPTQLFLVDRAVALVGPTRIRVWLSLSGESTLVGSLGGCCIEPICAGVVCVGVPASEPYLAW